MKGMRTVMVLCMVTSVGVAAGGYGWAKTLKSKPASGSLDDVKLKGVSRDLEKLDQALTLSLRQKEEIEQVLKREKAEKVRVMKDAAQAMRDISVETDKEIRALLTEAQLIKLGEEPDAQVEQEPVTEMTDEQADEFLKTFK